VGAVSSDSGSEVVSTWHERKSSSTIDEESIMPIGHARNNNGIATLRDPSNVYLTLY
jgi:hypothetical protein